MRRLMGLSALLLLVSLTGCKGKTSIFDKATFKLADNLETVRVSLLFTNKVKAQLSGGFPVKEYGYLFINPYTEAQPFEVGFELDTDIVNEQDYIHLEPTMYLPNGEPIGITYPIVEVRRPNEINDNFDVFAYVDVKKGAWLGVSVMFKFISNDWFPEGLTVHQTFKRDAEKKPALFGKVFGPLVDDDGNTVRGGGIGVFANIKTLFRHLKPGQTVTFRPEAGIELSGPAAEYYESRPAELLEIESNLIRGFNSQL